MSIVRGEIGLGWMEPHTLILHGMTGIRNIHIIPLSIMVVFIIIVIIGMDRHVDTTRDITSVKKVQC